MKKTVILAIKVVVMGAVLAFVAWKLRKTWTDLRSHPLHLDARYLVVAVLAYLGVLLTNALTWRWIAWRMGDRSRTVPLLGAYTFSQLGKYVPGKVLLVLLRAERATRLGMARETCLLSTLLENAMYTLSAGLVGAVALAFVARDHPLYLGLCVALVVFLLTLFHPRIFYPILNRLLAAFKRSAMKPENCLPERDLAMAVALFFPSWIFGGVVLWATVHSMHGISPTEFPKMCGAFALSVCLGMFSLLPGGLGVREAVQALFLAPLLHAGNLVVVAVALPRLMQMSLELILAGIGLLVVRHAAAQRLGSESDAELAPRATCGPQAAA